MKRDRNRSCRRCGSKARGTLQVEQLESRLVLTAGINETFVATLYQGVLGRDVDQAGLSYWAAALNTGTMTRTDVATGIFHSEAAHAQDLQNDYLNLLGRSADSAGVNTWLQTMQAGASRPDVEAGIAGSDEFFRQAGGTTDGFLKNVYRDLLGRDVDAAGKTLFGGQLAQGASRTDVARQVAQSQEAAVQTTQTLYQNVLGRNLDQAGRDYWSSQLSSGAMSRDDVAGSIAGSDEVTLSISIHLGGTGTDDPNAAASEIEKVNGTFVGFLKSRGQPTITVQPDPHLQPLVLSSTASNRSPTASLSITNSGDAGSLVHYKVTGSISGPNGTIPLILPRNAQGTLAKDLGAVVQVGANAVGLPKGIYDGTLTVTDVDGIAGSVTVPIKLAVDSQVVTTPPVIGGGGSFTTDQPAIMLQSAQSPLTLTASPGNTNPTADLTITNSGADTSQLHYQVTGSIKGPSGTIAVTSSNGQGTLAKGQAAVVHLSVNAAGLAVGTYSGTITVTDANGQAAAQTEQVQLTVDSSGVTGTYSGTYQGSTFDGTRVSGNLTLKITSATTQQGTVGYLVSGTLQATNFFGQTISVPFGPPQNGQNTAGNFDTTRGFGASSDSSKRPLIQLIGSQAGSLATVSGSAGHYTLSGSIDILDAQGNLLAVTNSSFTLTQSG